MHASTRALKSFENNTQFGVPYLYVFGLCHHRCENYGIDDGINKCGLFCLGSSIGICWLKVPMAEHKANSIALLEDPDAEMPVGGQVGDVFKERVAEVETSSSV